MESVRRVALLSACSPSTEADVQGNKMKTTFEWALYNGNIAWLRERTLYITRHGSHAYGTSTPTSDIDVRGLAVAPMHYYLGVAHTFEQVVQHEPIDLTIFDLRKFAKLAADANPNALEILFTDPSDHLLVHPLMERLFAARELFLSTKALHTFSGYARAQFKRIQAHRRWLLNPPKAPPTRGEFGLPERTVIPADQLAAAQASIRDQLDAWQWKELDDVDPATRQAIRSEFSRRLIEVTLWNESELEERVWHSAASAVGYDANFIRLLDLERQYTARHREWTQFQDWKKNRNPDRAAMEAESGYDRKHAMHLCRLGRMCRELLTEGVVRVRRPDADELLAIRNGAWTFEQLQEYADNLDAELQEVVKASKLPRQPNRDKIDQVVMETILEMV